MHEKIRENPVKATKARSKPSEKKIWKNKKITYEERKERLKAKLASIMAEDDE
jgi:large subunit ribosomal protein L5e